MKRLYALCSICLTFILYGTMAHADIMHHSADLFIAKTKPNPVKAKSASKFRQLASARFILDKKMDASFSLESLIFAKSSKEEEKPCELTELNLPANCATATESCEKEGVTYYADTCETCSDGYVMEDDGVCVKECIIEWGEAIVNGENAVDDHSYWCSSQFMLCETNLTHDLRGTSSGICGIVPLGTTIMRYARAYTSCNEGYDFQEVANGYGYCNTHSCDENDYPYLTVPEICKGDYLTCHRGERTLYGCAECNVGYIQDHGLCAKVECGSGFGNSCPAHGVCEECQSGADTKYKLTGCETGYTPNNEGSACVVNRPDHAFAFEVTTTQSMQGVSIAFSGGPVTIDWGSGPISTIPSSGTSYKEYPQPGTYEIYVTGAPTRLAIKQGQEYVTRLIDISLPSITSYEEAFVNCVNMTGDLTNMTFPSGLTNGWMMFDGCRGLTGTIPALPSSLTNGEKMFVACDGLTGFGFPAFPDSLTDGSSMFEDCRGLTGTIPALPSSLTNGEKMFAGDEGLTGCRPELPEGIKDYSEMFDGTNTKICNSLGFKVKVDKGDKVIIPLAGPYWIDWGDGQMDVGEVSVSPDSFDEGYGMPDKYDEISHTYNSSGTFEVHVKKAFWIGRIYPCPDEVLDISLPSAIAYSETFANCSQMTGDLTNMAFPAGLKGAYRMFAACQNLTGRIPDLPAGLVNADTMFPDCRNLSGRIPELPDSLIYADYMFANDTGLTGCLPTIPASVKSDPQSIFEGLNLPLCHAYVFRTDSRNVCVILSGSYQVDWGDGRIDTGSVDAEITEENGWYPSRTDEVCHSYSTYSSYYDDYGPWNEVSVTGNVTYVGRAGCGDEIIRLYLPSVKSYRESFGAGCSGPTFSGRPLNVDNVVLHEGLLSTYDMFSNRELTGHIPALPNSLINAGDMFVGSTGLTGEIPELPNNLTYAGRMFENCSGLTGSAPELPSSLRDAHGMFNGCTGLTGCRPVVPNTVIRADGIFNNTNLSGQCTPSNNSNSGGVFAFIANVPQGQTFHIAISGDYTIDWGDGTVESGTGNVTLQPNGRPVNPNVSDLVSHTYTQPPVYPYGDVYVDQYGNAVPLNGRYIVQITGSPYYIGLSPNLIQASGGDMVVALLDISLSSVTSYFRSFYNMHWMEGNLSAMRFPSGVMNANQMFRGCHNLTGNIPPLPASLEGAAGMFQDCSGLQGDVPTLPSGLVAAQYMFAGTGLSGTCPARPSSLEEEQSLWMYSSTNITCSYGQ